MYKRTVRGLLLSLLVLALLASVAWAYPPRHGGPGGPGGPMMMDMTTPQWDGQTPFDKWFLDNMIPHHQQAVMMSRMLLRHSQREEMKALGNDIIQAQLREIDQMQGWRSEWFNTQPLATHPGMMRGTTGLMRMDCCEDQDWRRGQGPLAGMDVDRWFLEQMIPHHQGAIEMSQAALEHGEHQEIRTLAQSIIDSQQREIDQMRQWQAAWYPESP